MKSIKYRFLIFSVILYLVILAGGGGVFFLSMGKAVQDSAAAGLSRLIETRRLSLEGQVSKEIALALKMAGSPLIRRYFLNPGDRDLEAIAFEEIAGYRAAFTGNNVFWINDTDRRYYFGDEYVYTLDPADSDSGWYTWTLNQSELFNFNVNYDIGLKKTMLWINALVHEGGPAQRGRATGIVGTGIDLTDFINALFGGGDSPGGGAELYLFNSLGEITGARDSALMETKETLSRRWGKNGETVEAAAKGLRPGELKTFKLDQTEYALSALPQLNWYVAAALPLGSPLESPLAGFFLLMLLVILIVMGIINGFIFRLVKPLNKTVAILTGIADTWDLTRRLDTPGDDEIGRLSGIFNLTFEKIQGLVTVIRDKTQALSKTGAELAEQMDTTADSVGRITAAIQTMRGLTGNQSGEVSQVGASMTSIMEHIEKLNGHIAQQSETVAQSSAAIEEMLSSIKSVTETLVKNSESVEALAESTGKSRRDLQKVSAEFQEIARQSEGLLEINAVVENIASQTNLLSMNAAIEAAHAGEAGKGFAVVAGEIRKLAEDSSRQSQTTAEMLKKIKASIDTATQSTAQVLGRFEDIGVKVRTVADQEAEIRNAMEAQAAGSRQILDAVIRLRDISGTVREEAEDIARENQEALRESGSLERISVEIESGMTEMSSGAGEIHRTVNRINEISGSNKTSIDILSGEVLKFKV